MKRNLLFYTLVIAVVCLSVFIAVKRSKQDNRYSTETYLNNAHHFMLRHEYKHALEELLSAIHASPLDPHLYKEVSVVYEAMQEYTQAEKYLKKAIEINPSQSEYYSRLGVLHMQMHRFSDAEQNFKKGVALDRKADEHNISIYLNLATYYESLDRYDDAEDAVKRYLAYGNKNPDAYYYLASLLCYKLKRYDQALQYAEKLVQIKRGDENLFHIMATSYYELKLYESAATYFNKIIELNNQREEIYVKLADIYMKQRNYAAIEQLRKTLPPSLEHSPIRQLLENYDTAQKAYETAVNTIIEQSDAVARKELKEHESASLKISTINKVQHLEKNGEYKDAAEELKQYLNNEEDDPDVIRYLAHILCYKLKQYQGAIVFAAKLIDRNAADEDALYLTATSYVNLGDYETARGWFEKVLLLNPQRKNVLLDIADCYQNSGQPDLAIQQWKNYLTHAPYSLNVHDLIAASYFDRGFVDDAVACYDEVTAVSPLYSAVRKAELYERIGNNRKSLLWYEHAKELFADDEQRMFPVSLSFLENKTNLLQAQVYEEDNEYDKAFNEYAQVLKHDPTNANVFNRLNALLRDIQDYYINNSKNGEGNTAALINNIKTSMKSSLAFSFGMLYPSLMIISCVVILLVLFDSMIWKKTPANLPVPSRTKRVLWHAIILLLLSIALIVYRAMLWRAAANNSEFLFRGLLGKDIVDGLRVHFYQYRTAPHDSSTSLVGLLWVPFLVLFGDSFMSFYIVALLLPLITLLCLYYITNKYFNENVAIISSFLYVFVPSNYMVYYAYVLGFHSDVPLFFLLLTAFLYGTLNVWRTKAVYFNTKAVNKGTLILSFTFLFAGLCAGFISYVCYTFIAALCVVYIFWLIWDRALFKRPYIYIFSFGVCLIFLPWVVYNFHKDFVGFFIVQHHRFKNTNFLPTLFLSKGAEWKVTWYCLLETLRSSFWIHPVVFFTKKIPPFLPGDIVFYIMGCSFVASVVVVVKKSVRVVVSALRKSKERLTFSHDGWWELLSVIFISLMAVLYCLYPMVWPSPNYFHPAYPFIFILTGIFRDRIYRAKIGRIRLRAIALILVVILAFAGFCYVDDFLTIADSFDVGSWHDMVRMKGYSLAHLPQDFIKQWEPHLFILSDLVVAGFYGGSFFDAFNKVQGAWIDSDKALKHNWYDVDKDFSFIDKVENKLRPFLAIRLGLTIGDGFQKKNAHITAKKIQLYVPREYHHYLYEGIAIGAMSRLYSEIEKEYIESDDRDELDIPEEYIHYFDYALGQRIAAKHGKDSIQVLDQIGSKGLSRNKHIMWGIYSSLPIEELKALIESGADSASESMVRMNAFFLGMNLFVTQYFVSGKEIYNTLLMFPRCNRPEFYYGITYGILERLYYDVSIENEKYLPVELLPKVIQRINRFDTVERFDTAEKTQRYLYKGIGINLAIKTLGQLSLYNDSIVEREIPAALRTAFYEGFGIGLAIRYGEDQEYIDSLIEYHVQSKYRKIVKEASREKNCL